MAFAINVFFQKMFYIIKQFKIIPWLSRRDFAHSVDFISYTYSSWGHTCKKREIPEIYLRNFFGIFRKILGWEREINTAPKPLPEVAPSKMEVAPS